EPRPGAAAGDGVPDARLRPHLPQLQPRARGGALRRRRVGPRAPRGPGGAAQEVRAVSFRGRLYERARRAQKRIVLPEGDDARIREAAQRLTANGLGEVEVLGDVTRDSRAADCAGLLRARHPEKFSDDAAARAALRHPLVFGAALVGLGRADPTFRSPGSSRATPRSWPTSPGARRPARPWRAAPTCSCSPILTAATSPTNWCSAWAAGRRSARSCRAWRDRSPTCRAVPA